MDRILIADDDLSLCHFLTKTLSQKGYKTLACHSGKDTLDLVCHREADLVLLDYKLPDQDGLRHSKRSNEIIRRFPLSS